MARANFSAGLLRNLPSWIVPCRINLSQKAHCVIRISLALQIRPLYQQILIGRVSFQIDEAHIRQPLTSATRSSSLRTPQRGKT